MEAAAILIERPAKGHSGHPVQSGLAGYLAVLRSCHGRRLDLMFYTVNCLRVRVYRFRAVTHPTPVPQVNVADWRASRLSASKGTTPSMVLSEPAPADESSPPPLLRVEWVTKSFPGVLALQDVSL